MHKEFWDDIYQLLKELSSLWGLILFRNFTNCSGLGKEGFWKGSDLLFEEKD